jgi:DHA3 family macrolide efflux protein-like MFS transporter
MTRIWKRDAFVFLSSQVLSLFGSSLVQYALMWHITHKTKSGTMMTLFVICGFLPSLILSPFAGVLADRFDRKRIIMLADGMIAAVTLALAAAFSSGAEAFWLMFLAAAARAAGSALQQPAVGAYLPQIVPAEALTRVNGINGSLQAAIMIVSPILSGILMSLAPLGLVFLIDVGTAVLAITVLGLFLRIPPNVKAATTSSYFNDLRTGLGYIRGHGFLMRFFAYLAVLYVFISPSAFLTPLQVARSFGPEVWRLTAIEIAFSGGMMAGGSILAAWGGFRNRMATILASIGGMGLCAIGLGLLPCFWPYLGSMAVFGLILPFLNTPATVLLQERVDGKYLGRVMSVLTMISSSVMPMSMLAYGPLAERVSVEWLLLVSGAAMAAMALLMSMDRILMRAGTETAR